MHHQPTCVALWIPEFNSTDEVWLTSGSDCAEARTMASALKLMEGLHIGLSREHFFQLAIDPLVLQALFNAVLGPRTEANIPTRILPMEVENGALLVQRDGADWAVAISRQHRQRLRRDPSICLTTLTTIHYRPPSSMWTAVKEMATAATKPSDRCLPRVPPPSASRTQNPGQLCNSSSASSCDNCLLTRRRM